MMQTQRGQTLPLTLAGLIAMLVFGIFALNYANTIRWQIRAQSAADSAAQAIMTVQTQDFNNMNVAIYATAIEEYRIRKLLDGMVYAAHNQGGCIYAMKPPTECDNVLTQLGTKYDQAVVRYTEDVKALQRVTSSLNYGNVARDSQSVYTRIKNCASSLGGGCPSPFSYGPLVIAVRQDTQLVDMDAKRVQRPYPNKATLASGVNVNNFGPIKIEVSVCAVVPPVIPSFLGWNFAPFLAIGRGAATPVMVEQDWMQPGTILNPQTARVYQPKEQQQTITGTFNDWYDLDFGGNGNVANPVAGGYGGGLGSAGFFSAYIGWWNSIPIHVFSGPQPPGALGCP